MKKIFAFLISGFLCFSGFCHKAQKQTEKLMPEAITQKWLEWEAAGEEDAQSRLEELAIEIKKAQPSDTIIYYFPEAKVIHDNLVSGIIGYILRYVEAYKAASSQTDFLTFLWDNKFHSKLLLQIAVRIPVNIADRFICTFAAWGVFLLASRLPFYK